MKNTNTGGPAFPVQSVYIEDQQTNSQGMTLRDYFASKTMVALIDAALEINEGDEISKEDVCSYCYEWADAMLKARTA